ncbi:MAG: molybdenum cofactor biosynthesis protein MoaE [Xanthomonadales bacterium]|nr:molybdenum cofactor biosynthesis protein MoaE [Xanthomonadales bacterium]
MINSATQGFWLADSAIDATAFREQLGDESCGACVIFEGRVRNHNEGRAVLRLAYEAHAPMALKEGAMILQEATQRFAISKAAAVHRQGELALTEAAVVVGVASAHRDAAFQACRYIIDEIKHRLPIWKKEYYADGTAEWVNCRQCAAPHAHGETPG